MTRASNRRRWSSTERPAEYQWSVRPRLVGGKYRHRGSRVSRIVRSEDSRDGCICGVRGFGARTHGKRNTAYSEPFWRSRTIRAAPIGAAMSPGLTASRGAGSLRSKFASRVARVGSSKRSALPAVLASKDSIPPEFGAGAERPAGGNSARAAEGIG
jgi:hypothetical protein